MLKNRLQQIITIESLDIQRSQANAMAMELGIEILDLAAALICLSTIDPQNLLPAQEDKHPFIKGENPFQAAYKWIRYRLDAGSQHHVTEDELKLLLVNESGVDKNNIHNINIQGAYTLIDLPDNMPQDIFLHLKTVEINQQKLDIKRVKSGNHKKRGKNNRSRRARHRNAKPAHTVTDQANDG
jgi:hypothetical protein